MYVKFCTLNVEIVSSIPTRETYIMYGKNFTGFLLKYRKQRKMDEHDWLLELGGHRNCNRKLVWLSMWK
jgi:hypothetical protein